MKKQILNTLISLIMIIALCMGMTTGAFALSSVESSSGSASKPPAAGGGGGGGSSSGIKGIECYTLSPDGKMLESRPEDNSKVKFVVQATLGVEPGVVYGVGIYDEYGALKNVEFFKSQATERLQHDFIELETLYDSNNKVKIFTLDSKNLLKPLRKVYKTDLRHYDKELPKKEIETEGITAYRGYPCGISANSFTLCPNKIRSFGYWSNVVEDDLYDIECSDHDVWFYDFMGVNEYMIKSADGKHSLSEIKSGSGMEFVRFNGSEILSASSGYIVLNEGGKEIEYPLSSDLALFENTDFLYSFDMSYFGCEDGLYTMAIDESGMVFAISLKYAQSRMSKIQGIWSDCIEFENGWALSADDLKITGDAPKEGDVAEVVVYGDTTSLKTIQPVAATCGEEGVEVGGKIYEPDFYTSEYFVPGESCLAYFYSSSDKIGYIEKNINSKELIVIINATMMINGDICVDTSKGEIALSDTVYYNGMALQSIDFINVLMHFDFELPVPAYYEKGKSGDIFELFEVPTFSGNAYYRATANMFDGYLLKDSTLLFAYDPWDKNSFGEVSKSNLKGDMPYSVKIYSKDGIFADIVLFNDLSILNTTSTLIISDIKSAVRNDEACYEICGYSDGEEITLYKFNDLDADLRIGDIISASYNQNNEISNITKAASLYEYASTSRFNVSGRYSNNTNLFGIIRRISDGVITLDDNEGNTTSVRFNESGYLYVYYPDYDGLELISIDEIKDYTSPADLMFINARYGITNFAVIVKY